jgi:hypothetical protein
MRDDVNSPLGRGLGDAGTLLGSRNEGGSESVIGGGLEITAMSGAHHAFVGLEIKGVHCPEIDGGFGFVISRNVSA